MGNWFKDLMNKNNKKLNLYDREGCEATGQITCAKGNCDCDNCEYAEIFLRTGSRKNIYKLLDEADRRLKRSKEILDEVSRWAKSPLNNKLKSNGNKNIHYTKEEKALKRELNIRLNNTPKEPYIYEGNERIETDFKTYVEVRWNNGTITKSVCKFGDTFNYGYGLLITTAKKFVKKLNFNFIESITFYNRAAIIGILELLIANTAGNKCVKDIRKEASFEYNRKYPKRIMLEDLVKKLYEKGIR